MRFPFTDFSHPSAKSNRRSWGEGIYFCAKITRSMSPDSNASTHLVDNLGQNADEEACLDNFLTKSKAVLTDYTCTALMSMGCTSTFGLNLLMYNYLQSESNQGKSLAVALWGTRAGCISIKDVLFPEKTKGHKRALNEPEWKERDVWNKHRSWWKFSGMLNDVPWKLIFRRHP